jgi:hypothetical protein
MGKKELFSLKFQRKNIIFCSSEPSSNKHKLEGRAPDANQLINLVRGCPGGIFAEQTRNPWHCKAHCTEKTHAYTGKSLAKSPDARQVWHSL